MDLVVFIVAVVDSLFVMIKIRRRLTHTLLAGSSIDSNDVDQLAFAGHFLLPTCCAMAQSV